MFNKLIVEVIRLVCASSIKEIITDSNIIELFNSTINTTLL